MQRVVIIGGGFAGLHMIEGLTSTADFLITLVDRNDYGQFSPLLSRVATGFADASAAVMPLRKIIRNNHQIQFRQGEFIKIIPEEKKIVLSTGMIVYDYVVFATGLTTDFQGLTNIKRSALPVKTLDEMLDLRLNLNQNISQALVVINPIDRKRLLTIVIAGAGPCGVEMAGKLADFKKLIFPKDFTEFARSGSELQIILIESKAAVLPEMSKKAQLKAHQQLVSKGVIIYLNTSVTDFADEDVTLDSGVKIQSATLIWAAGVTGVCYDGLPFKCYSPDKRLKVNEFNAVVECGHIYAVGDCALQTTDQTSSDMGSFDAIYNIQQSRQLALNLIATAKRQRPVMVKNRGSYNAVMLPIGNYIIIDSQKPELFISGFWAWLITTWSLIRLIPRSTGRLGMTMRILYAWLRKDHDLRYTIKKKCRSDRDS